jgi:hypothetical protein
VRAFFLTYLIAAAAPARTTLLADPDDRSPQAVLMQVALLAHDPELQDPWSDGKTQAEASESLAKARRVLKQARDQYESLEPEACLKLAGEAQESLATVAQWVPATSDLIRALALEAAAHLLLGNSGQAAHSLGRLVALAPEYEPEAGLFNPDMAQFLQRQFDKGRRRARTKVRVTTVPEGAAVYFDDRFVGLSPATVDSAVPGDHYVRAHLPGHRAAGERVKVEGDATRLQVALVPAEMDKSLLTKALAALRQGALAPELATAPTGGRVLVLATDSVSLTLLVLDGATRSLQRVQQLPRDQEDAGVLLQQLLLPGTEPMLASQEVAPAASVAVQAPSRLPPLAWASGIAGGVFLLGGGTFGLLAQLAENEHRTMRPVLSIVDSTLPHQLDAQAMEDRARGFAVVADIFYAAAVVATVTGVGCYLWCSPDAASDVRLEPAGMGLRLRF